MKSGLKFSVILVTYNRLDCLKKALDCYDKQTLLPSHLLVVNNASTDGTREFLEEWASCADDRYQRLVLHLPNNLGGSGGYYEGMRRALLFDCDFLFLADDDAYAEPEMLEELEEGYKSLKNKKVAAICSTVMDFDNFSQRNRIHKSTMRLRIISVHDEEYKSDYFPIDLLSFVGAAIHKKAAQEVGLPISEYFICYDDYEYSLRLKEMGGIYCLPKSIIHHDVREYRLKGWKSYYDTRNGIDMIHRHYPGRYYFFAVIDFYIRRASFLSYVLRGRTKEYRRMNRDAIKDAVRRRLGKCPLYGPEVKS